MISKFWNLQIRKELKYYVLHYLENLLPWICYNLMFEIRISYNTLKLKIYPIRFRFT